ncbi:MAG TPA: dihydrofolate reductase family protein [Dermatophilaceae bacterium]|nr:dihydrofolate reductase family protein [Dermatophilaceae bacterium]
MGHVRVQQSISIDGFAAGLGTSHEHPLGVRGERLHDWLGDDHPVNAAVAAATFEGVGAAVVGRTMLEVGLAFWEADTFDGLPVFVPTHRGGDPVVVPDGSTFTLVTADSYDAAARGDAAVLAAVRSAQEAAGELDVVIFGGPSTARQAIAAGLVDELRLQVAHTLLGEGERLFDGQDPALAGFVRVGEVHAPGVTHVTLVRG